MGELVLSACGRAFSIACSDPEAAALVEAGFGGLINPRAVPAEATVLCRVERCGAGRYRVEDAHGELPSLASADELLFRLDKRLTIALQHERPDLYFLHAAAVATRHGVILFSAPAGSGKSTLALALVERGWGYLSDELAPVDPVDLTVHPYPHALCLKSPPPEPYRMPAGTLPVGTRYHVPVSAFGWVTCSDPMPLAGLVFVQRRTVGPAGCRRITAASATARLIANALNGLAHAEDGLTVAATLSALVPCFELDNSDLRLACNAAEAALLEGRAL